MITSSEIKASPSSVLKEQISQTLNNRHNNSKLVVDLDKPFNLYLVDEQAKLYLDAINDELFINQLYKPFLKSLDDNIERIFNEKYERVDFIDLGPGYPDKSAPLVKHLIDNGSQVKYVPVDINHYFLSITSKYFENWPLNIEPLNILFSELPKEIETKELNNEKSMRVVNIGFTFNNFKPDNILSLLKELFTDSTVVIIATQIYDESSINKSLIPYRSYKADNFNFYMLKMLGFNRDNFEYLVEHKNNRIEMGFVSKSNHEIEGVGKVETGDYFITSISYRYEEKRLIEYIERYFPEIDVISDKDTRICIVSMKEDLK